MQRALAWLNEMPVKKDKIGSVKSLIIVPKLREKK